MVTSNLHDISCDRDTKIQYIYLQHVQIIFRNTYVLNFGLSTFFASNLARAAWPAILASSVGSARNTGLAGPAGVNLVLVESVNLYVNIKIKQCN